MSDIYDIVKGNNDIIKSFLAFVAELEKNDMGLESFTVKTYREAEVIRVGTLFDIEMKEKRIVRG